MQFPYIEDYVYFLSGRMDNTSKHIACWTTKSPISLASYDVKFIESVSDQIDMGKGLTDKQALLVEKMISTYQSQLFKLGVEQPTVKAYRVGIRTIDRGYGLFIKNDKLHFKFQFDSVLIEKIKKFAVTSQGFVGWDQDEHAWIFALTEYNLSWVYTIAAKKVTVSDEVKGLFDLIVEPEKTPYNIQLNVTADMTFFIENGPSSMIDYLTEHVGFDNLVKLADYSGMLGYTISEELRYCLAQGYGEAFVKLCESQCIDYTPATSDIETVIKWAIEVDRLPIVVYNPHFAKLNTDVFSKYFSVEETALLNNTQAPNIATAKLVYAFKTFSDDTLKSFPLLISYANLVHGAAKKEMLDRAEKVVYHCTPLPK